MRSPGLAAVLAPLLACSQPADPDATATGVPGTSSSTGTSSPATGAASSDTTAGTDNTTSTGAPTTGEPGTTTTTTTGLETTGLASTTLATTDPDTTSTGSTGDPPPPCPVVVGNDYGDCAPTLGWAFDGLECTPRFGCDCAPDCDKFFPDAASCALTCAAAGHCNEDRVVAGGHAEDPIVPGQYCDGIYVCPASDTALAEILEQIFGMLTCELGNYPCNAGSTCAGLWQGELGDDEWLKVCAASLVPMADKLWCVVFGP